MNHSTPTLLRGAATAVAGLAVIVSFAAAPASAATPTRNDGRGDYRRNTIRVSVPRSCMAGPRWLRFAAWSVHTDRRARGYFDDANGPNPPFPRVFTHRVLRG